MQEKLKGLGVYKEGNELVAYLGKFERIMRESEVSTSDWAERLYPRLPERLCERVAQARDNGVGYDGVRRVLLKAAGETAITYGNQLFEVSSEFFKSLNAGGIMEWIKRIACGVCQGCTSVEDCALAIGLALLRKVLPQSGKAFLESRKVKDWDELRESVEDWMSGRQKGDFWKPLGGGPSESSGRPFRGKEGGYVKEYSAQSRGKRERVSGASGYLTCFNCGERGHKSSECKRERRSGGYGYRPPTCYSCGKVGHRSPECTEKKSAVPVKREGAPKKMSTLWSSKSGRSGNVAYGLVNGVRAEVLIDSGAELGSVPKVLVPKNVKLCNDVHVKGDGGPERTCRSFMCEFEIGGYRKVVRTLIDESEVQGVSCIVPFVVMNAEEVAAYAGAIREYESARVAEVQVLTRSMVREEKELDMRKVSG